MDPKAFVEQSTVVKAIRAYEDDILHNRLACRLGQCPKCLAQADGPEFFSRHEARARSFLVIVGRLIYRIASVITRWKCVRCKKPFTLYPPFALPGKRYVRQAVMERAQRYVETDHLTYRQGAGENGLPICRDSGDEERIDERSLAPSTVHRWISSLGRMRKTLSTALGLIKQAHPATTLFRDLFFRVAPQKYRSRRRGSVLLT